MIRRHVTRLLVVSAYRVPEAAPGREFRLPGRQFPEKRPQKTFLAANPFRGSHRLRVEIELYLAETSTEGSPCPQLPLAPASQAWWFSASFSAPASAPRSGPSIKISQPTSGAPSRRLRAEAAKPWNG